MDDPARYRATLLEMTAHGLPATCRRLHTARGDHLVGPWREAAGDRAGDYRYEACCAEVGLDAALGRWLDHYAARGIAALAAGAVLLRRRPGAATWVRTDALPGGRIEPCGPHLASIFAGQDFLERSSDDRALLAARLRPAGDLRVDQTLAFQGQQAPGAQG